MTRGEICILVLLELRIKVNFPCGACETPGMHSAAVH